MTDENERGVSTYGTEDPRAAVLAKLISEADGYGATYDYAVLNAEAFVAACDAVDPLRQADAQARFVALADAVGEALDAVIGIADDFIGRESERTNP